MLDMTGTVTNQTEEKEEGRHKVYPSFSFFLSVGRSDQHPTTFVTYIISPSSQFDIHLNKIQ